MKLKFKNQDFQTDAVNSVVDLFAGMDKGVNLFFVDDGAQATFTGDLGEGNAIVVDDDMLLQNMHAVQKRNNLPLTDANWIGPNLIPDAEPLEYRERTFPQFSIEMETGTGKTYVYTKTIFELNRKYGLTKFIIVVPSVAIREGVYKSFEVTKEHFGLQYDNVPCRYFIYNSAKLSDVRQFATSANIEIMIINIDAFKKAENIINQAQDKLNGDSDCETVLDQLYQVYQESHESDPPDIRDSFQELDKLLGHLPLEDNNAVFNLCCSLCTAYEHKAFLDGLQYGVHLMQEIINS